MSFSIYIPRSILSVVVGFFLTGCASVSVKDEQVYGGEKASLQISKPSVIYVENFGTDEAQFNVDREGQELAQFKIDSVNSLAIEMQKYLEKNIGPTKRFGSGLTVPHSGWLIRGKFILVNQGSRALRATVGFGAGGTKFETRVQVYDLAHSPSEPFLVFQTTGGSGAMPGAVAGFAAGGVIAAGAEAAAGSAKGLSSDAKRTARMITARISDYMFQHGWITEDKHLSPKMEDGDEEPSDDVVGKGSKIDPN